MKNLVLALMAMAAIVSILASPAQAFGRRGGGQMMCNNGAAAVNQGPTQAKAENVSMIKAEGVPGPAAPNTNALVLGRTSTGVALKDLITFNINRAAPPNANVATK